MSIKTCLMVFLLSLSCQGFAADLNVEVSGIKSSDGAIVVALFPELESDLFPEDEPEKVIITDPDGETVTVIFEDLPVGEYAIAAFHDENNSGELDKNGIGLPIESYGNTGIRSARKPRYENSKFDLGEEDLDVQVKIE